MATNAGPRTTRRTSSSSWRTTAPCSPGCGPRSPSPGSVTSSPDLGCS